jgi:hypothetical protein
MQTWGSVLCHAIAGPPWARHLSEGMRLAALRHTDMAEELATFLVVVSSTAELVLGRSPNKTAHPKVVSELATKFQNVEGHRSELKWHAARICDLLLGPQPDRAWLADLLDEVVGQLSEELAAWREVEAELEALRSSVAQVQDLVLGDVDVSSLLVTSMFAVAERLEGRIEATTANGVHWGSRSALGATVSHFSELDTDLEVLGSGCNTGLIEDEEDTLWSRVRTAVDSLASHIPSSVARKPPDSVGE